MSEREQVLKVLAEIEDGLAEFLIQQVEAREIAGIDPKILATALLSVASAFLIKGFGGEGAVDLLLRSAAECRHLAMTCSLENNSPQARH